MLAHIWMVKVFVFFSISDFLFLVVPVGDPKKWTRDPTQLTVEGNKLYGRGVTDCLGHVALLTGTK